MASAALVRLRGLPYAVNGRYEWLWLYAAVEPTTGESFCLYMPHLDGICATIFLQQL